ncbi:MAG: peptidylprolyl isomerase [Dokdonella sp.]
MNKSNGLLAILALALVALAPSAQAQSLPTEALDRIVAVVDDDVVLQSELDRAVQNVTTQYARNPEQLPPRDVLEKQVLERLVMTKLQVARADTSGIKISDAEVDQALEQIAKQNGMELAQLRQTVLQQSGMSFDQFRKSLRDDLAVQRLRQRVVQSRAQVSDAEIDSQIKNGEANRGQAHLQHILISLPDGATPEQIDETRKKAEDVKAQISAGMDFSAAAIRYSQAQNALEGGDLGWRGYDELPRAFADLAQTMQAGQVSDVVRGPAGFHMIKLVEKRDSAGPQIVTEYHARHILIKTSELTTSDQAKKTVEDLRARAVKGEDFGKLAKEYSQDPNNANLEGDLGWFPREGYGTAVGNVVAELKNDQISQPFTTELGWHILQLLGTRTTDKTSDMERAQARQTLMGRKADEEYQTFLRQMRSESYVEIRLPGGTTADAP